MALDPEALFREHHLALYRYLVRLTGDEATAKDAVQHTFLRLMERPPVDENPSAWLYTVATNAVRDWARREQRRGALLEERKERVPGPYPEPGPERRLERRAARERVRRALSSLSRRDRAVLLLRAEGFRHREIAEAVGTTTGSVGTMIARALDRLATALDGLQEDEA